MQDCIHFIGIGGIGVSALAHVAQARGAHVSGSDSNADPASNPALARLIKGGASYYQGHRRENITAPASALKRQPVSLVVATAAVGEDNPEIVEARERGIRIVSRAAYLGELMAAHRGPKIAVAGTHGKTTTTGLIGVMLQHAGLDPTVFVGGEVAQLGGNVRIGSPDGPFVAEACEAYDSFLHLKPDIAVVTNVEADHLDHYGTEAGVFAAFLRFLGGVREGGAIVACDDDAGARRLINCREGGLPGRQVTYGIDSAAVEVRAGSIELGEQPVFLLSGPRVSGETFVRLAVPGRHNIENALASAAVGTLLGLSAQEISRGLAVFRGAERRQELLGEVSVGAGTTLVVDDYAHHPTEIRATLASLRSAYPDRRLIVVFQPHLYSRTRDFLPEFANALAGADALIVTDVYAAREAPIDGVRAEDIVTLARQAWPGFDADFVSDKREIPQLLGEIVRAGDLIVFMGAGDIRAEGETFVNRCAAARATS